MILVVPVLLFDDGVKILQIEQFIYRSLQIDRGIIMFVCQALTDQLQPGRKSDEIVTGFNLHI